MVTPKLISVGGTRRCTDVYSLAVMEFRFDVCRVLTERVTILSGGKRPTEKGKELDRQLETIIDNMGSASAKVRLTVSAR